MDLPVEIWIKIISYLPDSDLPKAMRISRNIFLAALSRLYRKTELHCVDSKTLQRFRHLK